MKDSTGNWIAQPPAYEPIVAEGKLRNKAKLNKTVSDTELPKAP